MKPKLIAPCGMNCNLCSAYLRDKNRCLGCRAKDKEKSNYCKSCFVTRCEIRKDNNLKYCSKKCEKYPCKRIKSLDKRYISKYGMSMIENLDFIQKKGIRMFIDNEKKRWVKGGKIYCVHKKEYFIIKNG